MYRIKNPRYMERMKRYLNWFKDELLADFPKKDTRPFIIGHPPGKPYCKATGRDARISGPIERSNRYPNCSYFTNWKNPEAEISWNVEVEESGLFKAFIYYTCDKRNIGSTFELRTDRDAENLVFTLDQVNDQPMLGADLDRVLQGGVLCERICSLLCRYDSSIERYGHFILASENDPE